MSTQLDFIHSAKIQKHGAFDDIWWLASMMQY